MITLRTIMTESLNSGKEKTFIKLLWSNLNNQSTFQYSNIETNLNIHPILTDLCQTLPNTKTIFIIKSLYRAGKFLESRVLPNSLEVWNLWFDCLKIVICKNEKFKKMLENNINIHKLIILIFIDIIRRQIPSAQEEFINFLNIPKTYNWSFNFISDWFINEGIRLPDDYINRIKNIFQSISTRNQGWFNVRNIIKLPKITAHIPSHIKTTDIISKWISMSQDGYEASYINGEDLCQTIRSNNPISQDLGFYYFEVKVINISKDIIGIGIISKEFNLLNKIPGWEANSIGYHSDDGKLFAGEIHGESYGPKYSSGDYVGMFINFTTLEYFFTHNGTKWNTMNWEWNSFWIQDKIIIFPAVGLRHKNQKIEINYGQHEFYFNYKDYIKKEVDGYYNDIINSSLNRKIEDTPRKTENWIMDYLLFNGYSDTYNVLAPQLWEQSKLKYKNTLNWAQRKLMMLCFRNLDFKTIMNNILPQFGEYTNSWKWVFFYEKWYSIDEQFREGEDGFEYTFKELLLQTEDLKEVYENYYKATIDAQIALSSKNMSEFVMEFPNYLKMNFNADIMFDTVNKKWMTENYSVNVSELDYIMKQIFNMVSKLWLIKTTQSKNKDAKETLVLRNKWAYLFQDTRFWEKWNKKWILKEISECGMDWTNTVTEYFKVMTLV